LVFADAVHQGCAGAAHVPPRARLHFHQETVMNSIIYIVGLIVVVMFVAGFFGLR
jgi:hypothetical protein